MSRRNKELVEVQKRRTNAKLAANSYLAEFGIYAMVTNFKKSGFLTLVIVCCLELSLTAQWSKKINAQLAKAGKNRGQIELALKKAPKGQKRGMEFLVTHMPERDLKSLSSDFLLENVRLSYMAWEKAPWKASIPEEIFLNEILPYASINERRDEWRADFFKRFYDKVKNAKSASQAAALLNQAVFKEVGVRYSTKRPKADQSPYESMEAGLASCTGLSIILIDACRSVGVPARFVGTPLWSDGSGNHSWVEVWDGRWFFTGAAEPTGDKLDRGWFVGRASKAIRDDARRAIYATSFKKTPQHFPLLWLPKARYVSAVNVTDRYTSLGFKVPEGKARVRFRYFAKSGERVSRRIVVKDKDGKVVFGGNTNDERFDANDHLTAVLIKGSQYSVQWMGQDRVACEVKFKLTKDEQLETLRDRAVKPNNQEKFTATGGTVKLSPSPMPMVGAVDRDLVRVASLLGQEIESRSRQVVRNGKDATVAFVIDENVGNPEAFELEIGDKVTITASGPRGAFYGSQALLGLMSEAGEVPQGHLRTSPRFATRSLLLDVGRKFLPKDDLKHWIEVMGWLRFNELHLHLNDNSWGRYAGYRLESRKFPGLASKDGHYTFSDIREIQDFARLRGVRIIPEIDSPGHALAFTTLRPELAHQKIVRDAFGLNYLDVSNSKAIKFMEEVWDEVCSIFDADEVHIGTDEYHLSSIKDPEEKKKLGESFRQYINHFGRYIKKKHNKRVRIWSGYEFMPGATEPNQDIVIDMWVTADAANKVAKGYDVINSTHLYTYIVPGAPYYGVNNRFILDEWDPTLFSKKSGGKLKGDETALRGGKLHIWNDFGPAGFTWNEIARLSIPSMVAMSPKLWGDAGDSYTQDFEEKALAQAKKMPGAEILSRGERFDGNEGWQLPQATDVIPTSCLETGLERENLEWPWTCSFELTRHHDVQGNEILLSSSLATVFADLEWQGKNGQAELQKGLALVRANQAFGHTPLLSHRPDILFFGYEIPLGQKVSITLVGQAKQTTLYVDGKLIKSLPIQSVCPLSYVGSPTNEGLHARIERLNIKGVAPQSKAIGRWRTKEIAETTTEVWLELPAAVITSPCVQVSFEYTGGAHRLDIEKVELLENDQVVSRDTHAGQAGGRHIDSHYVLPLKALNPASRYRLRISAHCDGGTDSNGRIVLHQNP